MPISVINILRNRILLFLCLTCHSQSKNIPSLWIWRIWLKFNIFNILHTVIICVQISYDKIAILLFFFEIHFNQFQWNSWISLFLNIDNYIIFLRIVHNDVIMFNCRSLFDFFLCHSTHLYTVRVVKYLNHYSTNNNYFLSIQIFIYIRVYMSILYINLNIFEYQLKVFILKH